MSHPAESNEYTSAVQRLRSQISDLRDLAEERLGLQQTSKNDPGHLWNLLDAISVTLSKVVMNTNDEATRVAARDRQLAFDETTDPIFEHMNYKYPDAIQAFEAWGRCRHRLRVELDILAGWASDLIITTLVIVSQISPVDVRIGSRTPEEDWNPSVTGQVGRSQRALPYP